MSRRMASLKRCGHWKVRKIWFAAPTPHGGYREECIDCGDTLSLGYSDERSSEAVEIEIRAAEIAADIAADPASFRCDSSVSMDECEGCGWGDFDCYGTPETKARWTGWLANAIHSHKETP